MIQTDELTCAHLYKGEAPGVKVIVLVNGHGDPSSNLDRSRLNFTKCSYSFEKLLIRLFYFQLWVNCRTGRVL